MNLLVFDYVEKFGYTYGTTFLSIIGVIPGLDTYLKSIGVNTSVMDSASVFTFFEQGNDVICGLGTTLQADGYLNFGIFGVVLSFFVIGRFVRFSYENFVNGNYYCFIIYTILIGHAVFWVRASFLYFIQPMTWALIIGYLLKKFRPVI